VSIGATGGAAFDPGRVAGDDGAAGAAGGPEAGLVAPQLREPEIAAVARGERTIGQGSRGPAVRALQEALRAAGFDVVPDGALGPKTVAAITAFQRSAGLAPDGKVGPKTLAALDRRLCGAEEAGGRAAGAADPFADIDALMLPAIGVRPAPARTTTIAPRPAAPAPRRDEPTPYDTSWFTDADKLEAPADVRKYLDQALAGSSHSDVIGLRMTDWMMASTAERATLIEKLLDGHTDVGDEEWILQMLQRKPAESAPILDELARRGRLGQLFADFQGEEYERLLDLMPSCAPGATTAASVVGAILESDTRRNRLAAHHIFDRARAGGYLDATLAKLRAAHPTSAVVNDLIAQAKPTRRPEVIAHRGGLASEHPENTMPCIRSAVEAGADGIEIDITLTADDRIILWHDYAESAGAVPIVRNLGLESTMGYRPVVPDLGHPARRPIYELYLAAVRANYGYAERHPLEAVVGAGDRVNVEIPTLDEVARYVKDHPSLKKVVLDVKLPPDRPDVQHRFAAELKKIAERYGLKDRLVLMHNDAGVVRTLKQDLGSGYKISHDVEIVSLTPSAADYSAVDSANRLGNTVASVGRPRIGIDGSGQYLEVLKKDRRKLDRSAHPQELYTWTINDELELREIMAIGVDGILTDDPKLLERLIEAYKL
jgi:glycerophosphoryl diester phosphodiesterase